MLKQTVIAASIALTLPTLATAEEFRQHDAHVHGQVEFNIAQDANALLVEITAPGADVVGFEHPPENHQQEELIAQAVKTLSNPSQFLTINAQANCKLVDTHVSHTLEGEHDDHHGHDHGDKHDEHHDHDHGDKHDEHHDHDHGDKHDEHHDHDHGDKHDEHHDHDHGDKHDEHHDHDHGDKHDEHHDHDHGDKHDEHHDHDHHDHEHGSQHGEFTAQYQYDCGDLNALSEISTDWFVKFERTEAIQVNLLTDVAQTAAKLNAKETTIRLK